MFSDTPNHMTIGNDFDGYEDDQMIETEPVSIRFTDGSRITLIDDDCPDVRTPKHRSVRKYTAETVSELAELNQWSNDEILTYIQKYHASDIR